MRAQAEGPSARRTDTPTSLKWAPLALWGGTISSLLTHLVRI
jgi:hypothetical protein